ncbi:hypothetical protein [Candidatus Electrothrix sp.]|uniref:hypothetical protein n=1 Tax=Candidatus Electrothrix sp. TaxID=2170559 RepID=UPI004056A3DC
MREQQSGTQQVAGIASKLQLRMPCASKATQKHSLLAGIWIGNNYKPPQVTMLQKSARIFKQQGRAACSI